MTRFMRGFACVAGSVLLSACAFASAPRPAREDAVFRGSGVIRTAAPGEIVISLHSFDESDGIEGEVDHEFHFWSETPLPRLDASFRAASVEYRGHELAILVADSQSFYGFVVDGMQQASRTVPAGFNGATFVGYGLNHSNRRGRSRIVEKDGGVAIETIFYPDYGDGTGSGSGGASCDSGGAGSTSCSATNNTSGSSCSVSCGSGYYACCNKGGMMTSESCKCIKL